jgi:maltose O-acetyltransferase
MSLYSKISNLYYSFLAKKKEQYINRLIKNGMSIGKNVEIIDRFFFDPSHCFLISIGDNCTICPNVRLIAHDASTKKFLGYTKIGKITIRETCFIGDSVIVLPGVSIGPNAIVGAGSVVKHNVPPASVAAGNPARVLCSLEEYLSKIRRNSAGKKIFSEEYYIEKLDDDRRKEILQSVSDSIGFIV